MYIFNIKKPNLELGKAVEVSIDVHHLDSFHGHHGDLRGDRQPVLKILMLKFMTLQCKM